MRTGKSSPSVDLMRWRILRTIRAVLDASSKGVLSLVEVRRQELRQQVSVRRVDLHAVESGRRGSSRRSDEGVHRVLDLRGRHLPAPCTVLSGQTGRSDGLHLCQRRSRMEAGVGQLQNDRAAAIVSRSRHLGKARDEPVVVNRQLPRPRLPFRADKSVARYNQADFSFGQLANQIHQSGRAGTVLMRHAFPRR